METRILIFLVFLLSNYLNPLSAQPCMSLAGQISSNSTCFSSGLTLFGDGIGGGLEASCNNCTDPDPDYQWQKDEGLGWVNISGANQKNYTIPSLSVSTDFRRTSTCDGTVIDQSNELTVHPTPPTPTITANGPTTFCAGGNVQLSSNANTGNQWFKDGVIISGAINPTYVATQSGNYTVKQTVSGCESGASNVISVTVNPIPNAPTITANGPTTFCAGGNVQLSSSVNSGNQWFKDGVIISGATNPTYVATQSGNYTVKQTVTGCESGASNVISVTVNPIPNAPTITANGPTTFCAGGNVQLTCSANTGNQWFKDGVIISGATNPTYVATQSGNYTVKQTVSGCESGASNVISVTVNPIPNAPTITANGPTTFCAGGNVQLSSSANTGNQWFKDGIVISGATNPTYVATQSGNYTVKQTVSGCASGASNVISVTVNPIPNTPTITANGPTTFCAGGNVQLSSSANTGNQWFKDGVVISGAINSTYVATQSGNYTVKQTVTGCESGASNIISVTVNPIPNAPTITANGPITFCAGGNVQLSSSANTGNQWFKDGIVISGATNPTYVATQSGNYTVKQTVSGCESGVSNVISVTVNPIPNAPTITANGPTTFCAGGNVQLSSSANTGNQWFKDGVVISAATNPIYVATQSGNYSVKQTVSGCESGASNVISVTVNPNLDVPIFMSKQDPKTCKGSEGEILFSGYKSLHSYELSYDFNGNPATPRIITSNNLGKLDLTGLKEGSYKNFVVKDRTTGCSSTIYSATINLNDPRRPDMPTGIWPSPSFLCGTDNSVTISVDPSSGVVYNWNVTPLDFMQVSGTPAHQFQFKPDRDSLDYRVIVTRTDERTLCTSDPATVIIPVHRNPKSFIIGVDMICERDEQSLSALGSGGQRPYNFEWIVDGSRYGNLNPFDLSKFSDGDFEVQLKVTDGKNCSGTNLKRVLIKNVPEFDIEILSTAIEGRRKFSPKLIGGTLVEIDSIVYKFINISKSNTFSPPSKRDTFSFIEDLIPGDQYCLEMKVFLKNKCEVQLSKKFRVNSTECGNIKNPELWIKKNPGDSSLVDPLGLDLPSTIKLCEVNNLNNYFIRVSWPGLLKYELKYLDSIYNFTGNGTIDFYLNFIKIGKGSNSIRAEVKYIRQGDTLECNLDFNIENQSVPKLKLEEQHFCHDSLISLNFSSESGKPTEFKVNRKSYSLPSNNRVDTMVINKTGLLQVLASEIKEENNICPESIDTFNFYLYRRPVLDFAVDFFCKNDSSKQLIRNYSEDSNAKYLWTNNGQQFDPKQNRISGIELLSSNSLKVLATYVYRMGLKDSFCVSEAMKILPAYDLPLAQIGEYTPGCGPFFTVNSLYEPKNDTLTRFSWSFSSGNAGLNPIGKRNEFVALTGNSGGNLILTAISDAGCYHHDTVNLVQRNFDLEQNEANKLRTNVCRDSSLFYIENPSSGECYKWFILDTVNFRILKIDQDKPKPFLKSIDTLPTYLLKYPCGEDCKGTLVGRGIGEYDKNCDENIERSISPYWVYPVPADQWVLLYSEDVPKSEKQIKVYNGIGHLVHSSSVKHVGGEFSYKLDLTYFNPGIYFFQINGTIHKFIVSK